jgi:hypothetical protein
LVELPRLSIKKSSLKGPAAPPTSSPVADNASIGDFHWFIIVGSSN